MISDWVYLGLDPKSFVKTEIRDGASISTCPSPYDVPEAVRANFDQSKRHVLIEFQYISEEPLKKVPEGDGVTFRLGKNSGRIYGIDLDLDTLNIAGNPVEALTGHVSRTIIGLASHQDRPTRQLNYTMATQAVNSERDNLFGDVVGLLGEPIS